MSGAVLCLPAQLRPLIRLKKEKNNSSLTVSQGRGNDPKSQATAAHWLELVCSVLTYST